MEKGTLVRTYSTSDGSKLQVDVRQRTQSAVCCDLIPADPSKVQVETAAMSCSRCTVAQAALCALVRLDA